MRNKKAFSFVEIIIVLSILILISIVIIKISSDSKDNSQNLKVKSDIASITTALNSIIEQEKILPLPEWNRNYFKIDYAYSHEKFDDKDDPAFWVYWKVTEKIIKKDYLTEVPLDPRTNQYYSYWKTREWENFEIAWVIKEKEVYKAKVTWNYRWDKWVISLIREYNWPYFVTDWWSNLPYNPEKIILTATDKKWNVFQEKDRLKFENNNFFKNNIKIEADIVKENWKDYYDLYFSDWSIWRLELSSKVEIDFWRNNWEFSFRNKWITSKISLFLETWKLWVFASDIRESSSNFDIATQDLTAAVRWTVFYVEKANFTWCQECIWNTKVKVFKWKVEIIDKWINQDTWWSEFIPIPKIDKNDIFKITKSSDSEEENKFYLYSNNNGTIKKLETSDLTNVVFWENLIDRENKYFWWEENKINILDKKWNNLYFKSSKDKKYKNNKIFNWNCFYKTENICDLSIDQIKKWFDKSINFEDKGKWVYELNNILKWKYVIDNNFLIQTIFTWKELNSNEKLFSLKTSNWEDEDELIKIENKEIKTSTNINTNTNKIENIFDNDKKYIFIIKYEYNKLIEFIIKEEKSLENKFYYKIDNLKFSIDEYIILNLNNNFNFLKK